MIRRLFRAAVFAGVLVGLLYAAVFVLERRGFFADQIATQLARYVGGEIEVDGASLRLARRVLDGRGLRLKVRPGGPPAIEVPEMRFFLPVGVPEEGPYLPHRIEVTSPHLRLVESADGTLSPLDQIKPWVPTEFVPTVSIADGTVELAGEGPLDQLLDELLRAGMPRRIHGVRLATFPEPAPSPMLIGFDGVMELPGMPRVHVGGSLGRDNAFHLLARVRDIELSAPELLAALDEKLAQGFARHVVKGAAELSFSYRTPPAEEVGAADGEIHGRLLLADGVFRHELIDGLIAGVRGELSFDGRSLYLHEMRIPAGEHPVRIDGVLDDLFEPDGYRLTLRAERLDFADSLLARIAEPGLRQAIDDFSPDGAARVDVEVQGRGGGEPEVRWSLKPLSGSGSFTGHPSAGGAVGFPYRLRDLRGEVAGENHRVEVRRVKGRHNGGGDAEIDGWVDVLPDRNLFEIQVKASRVPIDETLLDAIEYAAPGSGAFARRFQPAGVVDLLVTTWRDAGGGDTRVKGRVSTSGARATFDAVPIPLEDVSGAVEFQDDVYRIEDVTGRNGSATFTVNGSVVAGDAPELDLRISASEVRAGDPALWQALAGVLPDGAAQVAGLLELIQPAGTVDLEITVEMRRGGPLRFKVLLFPEGIDLLPGWLPVPLKGVVGRLEFGTLHELDRDDQRLYVLLDRLEGRHGGATLTATGHFGDGLPDWLQVRGEGVELSREILDAVAGAIEGRAELKGPALARIVRELEAVGRVAFRYRYGGPHAGVPAESVTPSAGAEPGATVELRLDGVDCRSAALPGGELLGLRGRALLDLGRDRIEARQLAADLAHGLGGVLARDLVVEMHPEGVDLAGAIDFAELPFEGRLAQILTPAVGDYLEAHAPRGRISVGLERFRLRLAWPEGAGAAQAGSVDFKGRVRLFDCALDLPLPLAGMNGLLEVSGGGDLRAADSLELLGRLDDFSVKAGRLALEGVKAALRVRDRGVEVSGVSGALAGGRLPADGNYFVLDTQDGGTLEGSLRVDGAALDRLLQDLTLMKSDVSGEVGLQFGFRGTGTSLATLAGAGVVEIKDGELWDLPVLSEFYDFSLGLLLGDEGKPTFESGLIEYRLESGRLLVDRFELKAPVGSAPLGLMLTGKGVLGPTGVDLRVVPQVILLRLGLLTPAIEMLKRGLLNYRIYGPLANPRVTYWNAAADVMAPRQDVTRLPRLSPRQRPDWPRRF